MFNTISSDNILPRFGEIGEEKEEMDYTDLTHVSRLDCPITLNPEIATFDDIAIHIMLRQRIGQSTTKQYMIYLRMMETHIIPVNLRKPEYEEFIRHMDYREQIEQATPVGLMIEWQSMRKILTSYGIPSGEGTLWNYKPPSKPPSKKRWIPLPKTVHEMLRYRYCKDVYKNALIQYTLMHSFMIGWRNPSEMCMMKLSDVDLENGTITITEKKKHGKQRFIIPDKSIITGQTRKSFKNWIDKWRPRVENQYSRDILYLRKNGKPYTEKQYRSLMYWWVNPVYPKYQPYISRHWCAIALLIKEKLETNHWNEFKVRNHLGHDRVQTTMTYLRDAEQYMQLAPKDWFKCVLKYHKKSVGENTLKTETSAKNLCFEWKPSESTVTIGLNGNGTYEGVPLEILQDEGYFDFQPFTLSLLFNISLSEDTNSFSFSTTFFSDSPHCYSITRDVGRGGQGTPWMGLPASPPPIHTRLYSLLRARQFGRISGQSSDVYLRLKQGVQSSSSSLHEIDLIAGENRIFIFSSCFSPISYSCSLPNYQPLGGMHAS